MQVSLEIYCKTSALARTITSPHVHVRVHLRSLPFSLGIAQGLEGYARKCTLADQLKARPA